MNNILRWKILLVVVFFFVVVLSPSLISKHVRNEASFLLLSSSASDKIVSFIPDFWGKIYFPINLPLIKKILLSFLFLFVPIWYKILCLIKLFTIPEPDLVYVEQQLSHNNSLLVSDVH